MEVTVSVTKEKPEKSSDLSRKLMALKRLTLVQSQDNVFEFKILLFGCNVARAFSRECSFDLIFSPAIFGHKIGVLKSSELFQEKEL